MKGKFAILFLVSLIFNSAIFAQKTRELTQETDDKKSTQKRVALVIGNGAYTKAKALPNPPNDAADMAQTLKDLGFEVISGVNQSKRQTETLIREFGTKLAASGGIGLFYYAGHGLQVGGENYLVPVDADIPEEDEVAYSAVPISLVLSKMMTAKNDLNIVILDACRNNPFARSWRSFRDNSNSDGLAKISPPTGTLVLYATEPGKVASDGAGRNGLFTEALLKQIKRPNLEYDQMVKALSADVWQKSNKQQLPWKEGNTLQDFYFSATEQKTNAATNQVKTDKLNRPEPTITQPVNTQVKIGFINAFAFDDNKKGITKYVNALNQLEAEFLPIANELKGMIPKIQTLEKELKDVQDGKNKSLSNDSVQQKLNEYNALAKDYKQKQEDAKKRYDIRFESVVKPIRDDIWRLWETLEKQTGIVLLDGGKLETEGLILAVDTKIDLTLWFINTYNNYLISNSIAPQVNPIKLAAINTDAFNKYDGIKRFDSKNQQQVLNILKAIQSFSAEKDFGLIIDSSKTLPPEIQPIAKTDVTKEFIDYYNRLNP